jgi:transcriptional regulator with XRE-family HTH domain
MTVLKDDIHESPLRRERERQDLSRADLGFFSGCSGETIRRLENGQYAGTAPALLARVARALRARPADLFPQEGAGENLADPRAEGGEKTTARAG